MEAITLKALAREVREKCLPGRVQGVTQFSPDDIVISLGGRGGRFLVLSASPAAAGIHIASRRPPSLLSPVPICLVMRRKLAGSVLFGIEQPGLERVLYLRFSRSAGERTEFTVAVEVMGRWSNIILVEEPSSAVAESLRHVPRREEGGRAVFPGETYRPPPAQGRVDITALDREGFIEVCRRTRRDGRPLREQLIGLGPGFVALAHARMREKGTEGDGALYDALEGVHAEVEAGATAAVYYPRRRLVLPLPVAGWDEPCSSFRSVSDASERCWRETLEAGERQRRAGQLLRELKRRKKKLKKKEGLLRAEAEDGSSAELYQAAGQALLLSLHDVPRGAPAFTFRRPEDPRGEPLTVDLDPSAGPRRNAEMLFKKSKKARRRAQSARSRLPPLLQELRAVEEAIDALPGLSLEELEGEVRTAQRHRQRKKAATPAGSPPAVREYRSDAWRVLVGRSSRGNDYLTSKMARPEDFWLHVRDSPGAHVVLRSLEGAGEPPPEAIRAAASIAAWHSALRGEPHVDVSYARRKHVRKVKGQAPGKVLLTRSSTVRVTPGIPAGYRLMEGSGPSSVVK